MASSMVPETHLTKSQNQYEEHSRSGLGDESRGRKTGTRDALTPGELGSTQFRQLSLSPLSEPSRRAPLDDSGGTAASPSPPSPSSPTTSSSSQYSGPRKTRVAGLADRFWNQHRAIILMLAATFFGVTMNTCARVLEHGGTGDGETARRPMHPMQMLFVRMSLTTLISNAYMYWRKTPGFPWGQREVRWLLLTRGVMGFFGIWGMWQSMMYLPLAEATVITFLVPSVSGYLCHLLIHEPFTRKEQIASFVALAGVVLIARPTSLLGLGGGGGTPSQQGVAASASASGSNIQQNATTEIVHGPSGDGAAAVVTPAQRLGSIGIALIGVLGTAIALLAIRRIGTRAHPLLSINYFSWTCVLVSGAFLVLAPVLDRGQSTVRFALPDGALEWLLLFMVCVCGFLTQFLLTASLSGSAKGGAKGNSAATSNRATSMQYTAMIFATASDKLVFGLELGPASFAGSALIIGSAMWAALSKKEATAAAADQARDDVEAGPPPSSVAAAEGEEGIRLLADGEESDVEEVVVLGKQRGNR